jgi:nicotinamide-nucleotide amidase
MKKMLDIHVLPMLTEMVGRSAVHFRMKTLSHFGIPESETDYRLTGIETLFPGIILGLQAVFPIIHVKLYARGNDEKELERLLDEAEQWCLERTGHYVFTRTGLSMAGEAGRLLRETGKTLAVAESCTGGLIASMLTDVPGSSDYFLFSGVTYSNDAKTSVLGVDREILTAYGAVSRETVMAMARGARRVSGADIAVATSGIAGPGGGTAEKPVGTVFFGIDSEEGCEGYMFISPYEDRDKNKTLFAVKALDLLRRNLVDK